jgi:hypothetical protein
MRYLLSVTAALLASTATVQLASAQQAPIDLVKAAVAAEGGVDALKALKGVTIQGESKHWEPGQSYSAGGEPRFLGDTKFTTTWNLAKGEAKLDMDRDMKYPAVEMMKYSEVITPTLGFVTDAKGSTAASAMRLAAQLRELDRASPTLLLKVLDNPGKVAATGNQKLGNDSLPAVTYTDGGTKFTILFDSKTHLPAAIRTLDDDNISGDSNYDVVPSDWKDVGGVKVAYSLTYNLNDQAVAKIAYTNVTANPTIADATFAPSDAVKAAAKAPATGSNVPYQWVLRRIALARFLDADTEFYPPNAPPKMVELGPNVSQYLTGTANNLIVNMKDGLAFFDAPYGELQSKAAIAAAKAKYPGKPIKYLILTHHHMDHTGGMRTFAAEGATIVVPSPDKAYFEKDLKTVHTVVPDALQAAPKQVEVVEVKDQLTLKDDGGEIRLYRIDNPHVDGMLLGHVVQDNVVWATDLYSPGRDTKKNAGNASVGAAIKKLGITGATFAGGHGANGKQADFDAIMAQN